jgi:hypothetical protein
LFSTKVENSKFVFPDSNINYISFNQWFPQIGTIHLKNSKYTDIADIINALKNMTLQKTEDPKYFGAFPYTMEIHYDDSSYTSMSFILAGSDSMIYFYIEGEYYVPETIDECNTFIKSFSFPYSSSVRGIKNVEFSNGFISFDNLTNVSSVEIITRYFNERGYNIGTNSVSYSTPQMEEEFLSLLSCLEFSKADPSKEISTSKHDYTLFKINIDSNNAMQIKMTKYESEFFFDINGEIYTLRDEYLELLKHYIPSDVNLIK